MSQSLNQSSPIQGSAQGGEFKPIIYFDGICGLCNGIVDFLLRYDRDHKFRFAPLQGRTAQKKLPSKLLRRPETFVYQSERGLYFRSTAVLKVLWEIGGRWRSFALFFIVPTFLRDFVYNLIALYRYNLFGKKAQCRVPSQSEKDYFLE